MGVPTARTDLSATAASNSPAGADTIGSSTGPDDYLRAHASLIRANYDDILLRATLASPFFTGTVNLSDANLAISGSAKRITADLSASTVANRTMVQTSISNGSSNLGIIPNGTSTTASFQVFGDPDATDCVRGIFGCFTASEVTVESGITGTATYVPMLFKVSGATQWGIEIDGRVYGTNLHNVGTVTGTAKQYLASGTFTPTAEASTNVTSCDSVAGGKWSRVGNVVSVTGTATVTPTAGSGADTIFYLTIPIASDFTETYHACGVMVGQDTGSNTSTNTGTVSADTTNNRVLLRFRNNAGSAIVVRYSYQYEIL
jgi:hypothetical protein